MRDIDVFSPQAWDSRIMRESWQVYNNVISVFYWCNVLIGLTHLSISLKILNCRIYRPMYEWLLISWKSHWPMNSLIALHSSVLWRAWGKMRIVSSWAIQRRAEFAVAKKGRGGRMEELFYSRDEWEIWKGSVGKTQRHRIEVWFWDLGEKCTSDSLLLRCTICKKACCWPIDVW